MATTIPSTPGTPEEQKGYAKPVSYKGYAPGTFNVSLGGEAPRPAIKGIPKMERVGGEVRSPLAAELEKKKGEAEILKKLIPLFAEQALLHDEFKKIKEDYAISNEADIDQTIQEAHIALVRTQNAPSAENFRLAEEGMEDVRSIVEEIREATRTTLTNQEVQKENLKKLLPLASEVAALEIRAFDISSSNAALKAEIDRRVSVLQKLLSDASDDASDEKIRETEEGIEAFRNYIKLNTPKTPSVTPDQKEIQLQKEVLMLSFEVESLMKESGALKDEISDNAIRTGFDNEMTRVEMLFATLKKNPEQSLKDDFDAAFSEYKKNIESVKEFIRQNPKPAAAAAGAAAAPAMPSTPLREYGGWPSSFEVFFRKRTNKDPEGWFFKGDMTTPLEEEEAAEWDAEKKNFNEVYKKYNTFIRKFSNADKQLMRPLFDARKAVVDAVRQKDITLVSTMREEFEKELESWEKKWSKLDKLKEGKEKFDALKKTAEKVESVIETGTELDNLVRKRTDIEEELGRARGAILHGDEYDLDKVASMFDRYEAVINKYKNTQEKTGKSVLRPIRATDKNRDQKIHRIGSGGTADDATNDPTVGEYARELEAQQREAGMVTLTQQDLAEWPELMGAHHVAGDRIERKVFEEFQVATKYARMLNRDENSFLSLYAKPSVDPDTQEVVYTSTDTLRKHPHQEIIRKVLKEIKNITVTDPTRKELKTEDSKKKEEEHLKMTSRGMTYNPRRDLRSVFGTMPKKTRISNYGGMQTNSKRKTVEMAQDLGNEPAPVPIPEAPLTPLQEMKRALALRKVNDVVKARDNWFTKNPKNVDKNGKLKWYLLALVVATAAAAGGARYMRSQQGESPSAAPGMTATAPDSAAATPAETAVEAAPDWREFFNDKEFLKDFTSLSNEQLAIKYAPKSIDLSKASSVHDFLLMEGYKLLNEPDRCYGLGDNERDEACRFIRKIEQLSQDVDAPDQIKAQKTGGLFTPPWNWSSAPTITITNYLDTVKAKIAQADKK